MEPMVAYKGLRARLAGDNSLITLLGGTAIYAQQAPANSALPYVVMALGGGGDTNLTRPAMYDYRVLIKCVAKAPLTAGSAAALIYARLHQAQANMSLDAPYTCYDLSRLTVFEFVENVERDQFWHAGGIYRLRANA